MNDVPTTPGAIRSLQVGQSVASRIVRLDGDTTNKTDIAQVHETFHRDITPIIFRLQRKEGVVFKTEKFTCITKSGDFLVGLCVTRTQ